MSNLARILDERLHAAQRNRAGCYLQATRNRNQNVRKIGCEHHRWLHERRNSLCPHSRAVQALIGLIELAEELVVH